MAKYNFKVIIEKDEDGVFVAEVPSLPGCYTQGKTYEEVLERIKEAILLNLEAQGKKREVKKAFPQPTFIGIEDLTVKYA